VSEAEGAEGQVNAQRDRKTDKERERERNETISWLVRDREEWWKRSGADLVILDKGQVTARHSAGGFSVSASIWICTCLCTYLHVHVHFCM
jgi:hypothetical protein